MKMKLFISYDKDFNYNNDDLDYEVLEKNVVIGYFDNIVDARKAVDEFIKEQGNYVLTEIIDHEIEEADIVEFYRKDLEDKTYYCIEIDYSLVLVEEAE